MTSWRSSGLVFGVAFAILLLDGAAAIWLGQIAGRGLLVAVGVALVLAAAGLGLVLRRWRAALLEIDVARRDLQSEIGALRSALDDARAGGRRDG
ncbi:MAG: hypothetical protein AABY85_00065 [Gemmatimonadota bacterium]|jgi:hypothetical protein